MNHYKASLLFEGLAKIDGLKLLNDNFFNEFVFELQNITAQDFINKMLDNKIFAGFAIDKNKVLVAATEAISNEDINNYINYARELC